jgi:catechol 2,3-dioxygenase-like lactoylglutathione lyase family enzyme
VVVAARRCDMIDYVTIGTNDLERARAFYDALLPLLGGRQDVDMGRLVF